MPSVRSGEKTAEGGKQGGEKKVPRAFRSVSKDVGRKSSKLLFGVEKKQERSYFFQRKSGLKTWMLRDDTLSVAQRFSRVAFVRKHKASIDSED